MVKEAEANAEEDKKRRELVEAKNHADALIHTTEKTLKDSGDKIPADAKQAIETAIAELKGVIGGGDVGQIRSKTEALAQASMKIGEAHVQGARPRRPAAAPGPDGQGGDGGAQGPQTGSEKVVDADFEEVDEKKKRGCRHKPIATAKFGESSSRRWRSRITTSFGGCARRLGRGTQEGLPQARHAASPGPQPGQQEIRAAVQGRQRSL